MHLKHLPEDFQVEERISRIAGDGPFALYRLRKRGLGTLEALSAVGRRWKLAPGRMSYGGLKDRHALTVQWVCIDGGPRRPLRQTNLELDYVGQTDRPLESAEILANHFRITLRDLAAEEIAQAEVRLPEVACDGVANYFDRQRFGSLGESGEFIARPWIERDYERAVWLALADPQGSDRPDDRRRKQAVRERWGQWPTLLAEFRSGPQRSVVEHLARWEGDFRGALARFPAAWRRLWVGAFESHLWNRLLAAALRQTCPAQQLRDVTLGPDTLPLYSRLADPQRAQLFNTRLPLPSARNHLEPGPLALLVEETLAREGLSLRQLKIDYPRDSFFSKGDRAAAYRPEGLQHEVADDECYVGRQKIVLEFALPAGCYATLLVRSLEH